MQVLIEFGETERNAINFVLERAQSLETLKRKLKYVTLESWLNKPGRLDKNLTWAARRELKKLIDHGLTARDAAASIFDKNDP